MSVRQIDLDVVAGLVHRHLPTDVGERWWKLLRPAARLRRAQPGEPVVGRFGGTPSLPLDLTWPDWDGEPLSFVARLDGAALAPFGFGPVMPAAGHLQLFYADRTERTVGYWDPPSQAGARAMWLAPDAMAGPRRSPEGLLPFAAVDLTADPVVSAPPPDHHLLVETFGPDADHPVYDDDFVEALFERHAGPHHQVGGYPEPVQGGVEEEVAAAHLGVPIDDPSVAGEARRWRLITQIDSDPDAGLLWGDAGALYWMVRVDDLVAGRDAPVAFTWQSL